MYYLIDQVGMFALAITLVTCTGSSESLASRRHSQNDNTCGYPILERRGWDEGVRGWGVRGWGAEGGGGGGGGRGDVAWAKHKTTPLPSLQHCWWNSLTVPCCFLRSNRHPIGKRMLLLTVYQPPLSSGGHININHFRYIASLIACERARACVSVCARARGCTHAHNNLYTCLHTTCIHTCYDL